MKLLRRWARHRWAAPAFLVLAGLALLGPHAAFTGLHVDDHGFHRALARANSEAVLHETVHYVPGRNLHIVFYAGLYKLFGPHPERLHLFGLGLDLLNVVLAWFLLGQAGVPARWRLAAAGLFLIYPNHGETHFWTVLVVQCLVPTFLTLSAFLCAGGPLEDGPALGAAFALYAIAVYTYDQVFFMWIPLLFHAATCARRRPKPALAAFAVGALALNAGHFVLRRYGPYASGGRPMIRLTGVLRSVAHAGLDSFVPIRKLPPWDSLRAWGLGPAAVVAMALLLAWVWLVFCGEAEAAERRWRGRAAVFGAAWLLCAYLPNFFWYISPRHNYLPSLGLALVLCVAASYRILARWQAAAGFVFFALSAACAVSQGYAWRVSAQMLDSFRAAVPIMVPPGAENLFLVGAPRSVLGAPAFEHPQEAAFIYAEAYEAVGGHLPQADLTLAPTRTGVFFGNQIDLFGRGILQWRPYRGMNLLAYAQGRWVCARAARVEPEDGPALEALVAGGPRCQAEPRVSAPVWLRSSRPFRGKGEPLLQAGNGASLFLAEVGKAPRGLLVTLGWRASRPLKDFAVVVSLRADRGRRFLDPVYPAVSPDGKTHQLLWPAYDDLQPASAWKPGEGARQTFFFASPSEIPAGRLLADIQVFEKREGPWTASPVYTVPLERSAQ